MLTVFFISQKRQDYFNLKKLYNPLKHLFIAVLEKKSILSLPTEELELFSEIINIECISEISLSAIIESTLAKGIHAKDIRLVCPDEMKLLTTATIREKYGIPGTPYSHLIPFRDKFLMKSILEKNDIKTPKFTKVDINKCQNDESAYYSFLKKTLGSPFIVKPVLGASSLGTMLINTLNDFQNWHRSCNAIDMHDAEEYIEGSFYHCDSFIFKGKIIFSEISEYTHPCLDFIKGKTLGDLPLEDSHPLRSKMLEFNKKAITALKAPDGATHLEFFVNSKNNELVFIEVAARPPGGRVVKDLEKTYGVNLYELYLRLELGEDITINRKDPTDYYVSCDLPLRHGVVKTLMDPTLHCHFELSWQVNIGDQISQPIDSIIAGKAGFIVLHGSYAQARKDFEYLRDNYDSVVYE